MTTFMLRLPRRSRALANATSDLREKIGSFLSGAQPPRLRDVRGDWCLGLLRIYFVAAPGDESGIARKQPGLATEIPYSAGAGPEKKDARRATHMSLTSRNVNTTA
jgi:hypothetical protein